MAPIGNILTSHRKKFLVKRSYKDTYIYKNILAQLYPDKKTKTYAFYRRLIDKALLHIGVDDLFNIKLLATAATFLLVMLVIRTNVYMQANEIIEKVNNKSSMLFADDSTQQVDKEALKVRRENERKIFEHLRKRFSLQELKNNQVESVSLIAADLIHNNLATPDEEVSDLARRMHKKLVGYYEVQQIDWFAVLLFTMAAFFLPDAYLYLRSILIKYLIYNEYLQMEVIAIMVGKLEPITVEEILNVMSENSKYFKRYIDEVRYNYFDVKNGHSKAFDSVLEKITNKDLRYLMKTLQQASESDLKITIENLENQRRSNKEFRNIKEQNKLKKKDLLGIMVILVVLVMVCMYMFEPFSHIMGNFSL